MRFLSATVRAFERCSEARGYMQRDRVSNIAEPAQGRDFKVRVDIRSLGIGKQATCHSRESTAEKQTFGVCEYGYGARGGPVVSVLTCSKVLCW